MAEEKKATEGNAAKNEPKPKKTTSTAAKKTTGTKKSTATSTASKTTAKSAQTGVKKTTSTAKKSTATKRTATAKKVEEKPLPPVEVEQPKEAPQDEAPTYIDEQAVVLAGAKELTAAKPVLSFPEEMKKRFLARLAFVLGAVAILLIATFIYLWRPTAYTEKTATINFLYIAAEDKTVILSNGDICGEAAGALTSKVENGKGDVCVALFGEALYLITDDTVIHLLSPTADYTLAANGAAVAYRDKSGKLYYRETAKKATPTLITPHSQNEYYCLSPDGQELAYTWLDPQNGAAKLNIESFTASKPQIKENANLTPVAISNKCRFVYFLNQNGELFIFDAKKGERIACGTPDGQNLLFNRDFTEVMFAQNGATVFFVEGVKQTLIGITQSERINLLPNRRVATASLLCGTQYFTDSFFDNYYYNASGTGKKLMYMNGKGELQDLSSVDDLATVTVTDKGIFFLQTDKNGENTTTVLYRYENPTAEKELLMWDVSHYITNVDGSKLLYTDTQNTLYLYTHTSGAYRMADSILPYSLAVTADDLFCYYTEQGVLNVSDNGREPRVLHEGVVVHVTRAHTLLYITDMKEDGTFTVFANHRNQRKSDLIAEGIFSLR